MHSFNSVKLAVAPINWTNDDDPSLGGDISFHQCIREMHDAGFTGTEIGNKYPKDPQQLLKELKEYHLQVSSAWFSTFFTVPGRYQGTLKKFIQHMSFMRAVGADVINLCESGHSIQQLDEPLFSDKKPTFTAEQWSLLIQGLHQIGRIAHDFGFKVAYHYHLGTGVQAREEIDHLMERTSPKLLGLLLDTGHAYAAGVDPIDLIQQYGDRINQVHLKDIRQEIMNRSEEKQWTFMESVRQGLFTVPGDGCISFQQVFEGLESLSYRGWFVVEAEQDPKKANPLEYAKKARSCIRQLAGI